MDQTNTLTPYICNVCEGSGKIYNSICTNCGGSGYLARDNSGNIYLVKKENDSLVVVGPKNGSNSGNSSGGQRQSTGTNINDNNFIRIVVNVLFAIVLIGAVLVDFIILKWNLYVNIFIIVLILGDITYNLLSLSDNKVNDLRAGVYGENEVQDLHWAIEQIKKLSN
jgi:hypothetical protein